MKGKCIDINECLTDDHGCGQGCTNTNGSYTCHCRPGYHFKDDSKKCAQDDMENYLSISNHQDVSS